MPTIYVPDERVSQVALMLRRTANEFHGALAREPESDVAQAWKASADWFDKIAADLFNTQSDPMFK
jgi:hypothetical protein